MTEFVRVPKSAFAKWHATPWDQLVIAAEQEEDGLSLEASGFVPFPDRPPHESNFQDRTFFEKRLAEWNRAKDAAYFRRSDLPHTPNLALVYQQNFSLRDSQ